MKKFHIVVDAIACVALTSMFLWAFFDLPFWAPLERGPDLRAMGLAFFHVFPVAYAAIRRIG
jgi:hypothetical protein